MIRSLCRTRAGEVQRDLTVEALTAALQDSEGLLWVDFSDEPPESCEPILRQAFGFHPLAVDDALEETHVPRVDDWGKYLYLSLQAVTFDQQAEEPLGTVELDVFPGAKLSRHLSYATGRQLGQGLDGVSTRRPSSPARGWLSAV